MTDDRLLSFRLLCNTPVIDDPESSNETERATEDVVVLFSAFVFEINTRWSQGTKSSRAGGRGGGGGAEGEGRRGDEVLARKPRRITVQPSDIRYEPG